MQKPDARRHQARKTPKQSRSKQMRRDLLEGATRVLEDAGASGFTTNRVAEATGVSIGSLYQYYPNKGALLADLHSTEANAVFARLELVLRDGDLSPRERLMRVVLGAFAAQAAATEHHMALQKAGVPAGRSANLPVARIEQALCEFLEGVPERKPEARELSLFCAEVLFGLLERMAHDPERDWSLISQHTAVALTRHVGL